jgi:hypothetical protein
MALISLETGAAGVTVVGAALGAAAGLVSALVAAGGFGGGAAALGLGLGGGAASAFGVGASTAGAAFFAFIHCPYFEVETVLSSKIGCNPGTNKLPSDSSLSTLPKID